ncbi:hypothetical protein ACFY7Z_06120 [Streptomyces sp. NPDC012623]|uniref:hypothetical protein n=1 Tax=unclassified Streptomyces TaxID=2593676 RepID=UPI003693605F
MWQGQQPSGNEQHPSAHPNPYLRPAPWDAPTVTSDAGGGGTGGSGGGGGGRGGGDDRRKTVVVAVVAATAVVIAAGVTGWLVLGRDGGVDSAKKDGADVSSSDSASPASPPSSRAADGAPEPVVAGWKTVVNPRTGVAFDVPDEWDRKATTWVSYVSERGDEDDTPLVGFSAPALLKEKWCRSDEEKDGTAEDTSLAAAGSRTENSSRTLAEAARKNAELWVYGGYAQPDRTKIANGPVESYTTASGIKGSLATSASSGVEQRGKCDTDGKATAFAFENAKGDFLSWTFCGVKGVEDEVPDATIRKILSTVRLTDGATGV